MEEPEWICGLPFYIPTYGRRSSMKIGEVVEGLIAIKDKYSITYPDISNEILNNACNLLDMLPINATVDEFLNGQK